MMLKLREDRPATIDEHRALRAKVELLRAALQEIADWDEPDECAQWGIDRAKRALEQEAKT